MKNSIHGFSQARLVELELDNHDALILRWFVDFKDGGKMYMELVDGIPYYWIKYEYLTQELPVLKLKKDTMYRRLKKMVDKEVLLHWAKQIGGTFSFYALGPEYLSLIVHDVRTPGSRSEGGTDLNPRGYGSKSGTKDLSIKYSSIKDLKKEKINKKENFLSSFSTEELKRAFLWLEYQRSRDESGEFTASIMDAVRRAENDPGLRDIYNIPTDKGRAAIITAWRSWMAMGGGDDHDIK